MTAQQESEHILVVADDFTGANDAGIGFSRYGARVKVLFDAHYLDDAEPAGVCIISTDSRALDAAEAAARVSSTIAAWRRRSPDGWIYKKIDSTLRGNLGAEIEAALNASGAPLALIVAAAPAMGRTVRDGHCRVQGVLLTDTEFASDPKTPINSAALADRIAEQSHLEVVELDLAALRAPGLAAKVIALAQRGHRLVVVDGETQADLHLVIDMLSQLPFRPLLVGSAGLTEPWAQQRLSLAPVPPGCSDWLPAPAQPASGNPTRQVQRPLLAFVGSMSVFAQQQIDHALSHHRRCRLVDIDVTRIYDAARPQLLGQWCEDIVRVLAAGDHCIVRTCQDSGQRVQIAAFCQHHSITRQRLGEDICQLLGQLAQQVLRQQQIGGLYLTGGDVAIAVAAALGASGFHINGQIDGCVPYGRLLNSMTGNVPVMTKAGGFGSHSTLAAVICFIEEMSRD